MANVMFKRGLSTALPTTGNAGSFYLTTDTNRLYVCNTEGGALVELNQSINTVKNIGDLPTGTSAVAHGQYYYISASNVLAFYDANKDNGADKPKGGWVQINPDATLVDSEENTVVEGNDNAVISTSTIEDTEGHSSVGHVTFTGADAVTTKTGEDNTVIIEAHDTKYDLTSGATTVNEKVAAKIVLGSDVESETDTEVNVYGGVNITVENTSDGIKISAADAANMYNESVEHAYDATGAHTVTVVDGDGAKGSNKVTPTIKYGDGKTAVFIQEFEADGKTPKGKPTAELDVYDKEQVDSLISMADAMHYKGIVTADTAETKLNFATAQNGDTYKVGEKITTPVNAEIGDLVIAKGTEVDGSLASAIDAVWEVIPSGDSQVISASVIAETIHKFTIEDNATGAAGDIGSIEFFDDGEEGNIKITSAAVVNDTGLEVTVSHGKANANTASDVEYNAENDVAQTAESEAEFTAVTTLSYDGNGHIVSAETGTLKVVDTHNHLVSNEYATEGGSDEIGTAVQVTNTIIADDESKVGAFTLDSDTLKLSQNNGTISIDMIWGSF